MRSNGRYLAIVSGLVVVISVMAYFLLVAIYRLPVGASAESVSIDQMLQAHFVMIAFLWSLIVVFMLFCIIVFRRRPGEEGDGSHFHGHTGLEIACTGLEIAWTFIPIVLVLAFSVWGAFVLRDVTEAKENEMVVKVIGQQWSWIFTYPEQDGLTSTDLVLPVNRTIRLEMESQDVIHSFWVPEFRVKQDVVPGQMTILRVTPTLAGEYTLRCAEMCGLRHAYMESDVRVLAEEQFAAWVEEAGSAAADLAVMAPEERGAMWAAEFVCASCHTIDGTAGAGPTWQGLFGREETLTDGSTITVDEAYLAESILDPNAHIVAGFQPNQMPPNFEQRFEERQNSMAEEQDAEVDILADLIAYIKTLEE
jgi:cytochrome c oxidase subunit II